MLDTANGNSGFENGGSGVESVVDPRTLAGSGTGDGSGEFDPAAPFGRFANGKPRKRAPGGGRGSVGGPAANGSVSQAQKALTSIDALTGSLLAIHTTLAALTSIPEIMIREEEAKLIAKNAADLMSTYGGSIDPRAMMWANLAMAMGSVYGPRVLHFYMRTKQEKAAARDAEIPRNS